MNWRFTKRQGDGFRLAEPAEERPPVLVSVRYFCCRKAVISSSGRGSE